ncbi:unnamed protein product [Echinostoma caproni]|uniref:tRNA (guanine(9)-N(1))-methyltransferase n=1 Tax=Echinostoma caproni TaxID=27848 RepID=A0A183AKQ6_9TREM|nr:unnamed protein product [Echinostoma caproni]
MYIQNLPIPTNFIAYKYADDIVIGCPAPISDSFRPLQDSLNELHDWSVNRSLELNVSKCIKVPFSLKTGPRYFSFGGNLPDLRINNQSIPKSTSVKYLGVTLTHNLSWPAHVINVFTNVRKFSFYAYRLTKLAVPPNLIIKFVIACILPHWLYCSPIFIPGLKEKDFSLFSRSLKLLSRYSGVDKTVLVDFFISTHLDACDTFIDRIMHDQGHCLHQDIAKALTLFNPSSIVYLCNSTAQFSVDDVYVIGGFVDHNHHIGHCYEKAVSRAHRTARLPIAESGMVINGRHVLSTVQVFQALAPVLSGSMTWAESLNTAVPPRKTIRALYSLSETSHPQTSTNSSGSLIWSVV